MQKFHFFPVIRKLVNTSIRNLIPQVEPIYRNRLTVVMAAYRPEPNQAQDVVRCKICENDKVKYFMYCKNCGDKMCPQCQEEHIKHFENHVIVPNDERQFAGEHCKEHPTQFYDAGCKDCSTPICPECKLKYHFSHKNTSIEKACKSARKKVETNLKQMVTRHCRVTSFINEGTNFGNIQDFQQIKENLKIRALELKSCVENILSKSLAEVERLEEAHQTSVHKYVYVNNLSRERDYLEKRIQICTDDLKSMDPIRLAFYEEKRMK